MSKDKDSKRPNENERRPQPAPPEEFEGDLNFATDSDSGIADASSESRKNEDTAPPEEDVTEKTWTMYDRAGDANDSTGRNPREASADDAESSPSNVPAPGLSDTWVPDHPPEQADGKLSSESDEAANQNDSEENEPTSVEDTWVPYSSDDANRSKTEDDAATTHHDFSFDRDATDESAGATPDDSDDPNKTWVPSATPTVNGEELRESTNEDEPENDPNKTWVPSKTPTVTGEELAAEEPDESPVDPDKTWVPSKTPTVDGTNLPDSNTGEEADDPNKTWVPSESPTVHGLDSVDAADGEVDGGQEQPSQQSIAADSSVMDTIVGGIESETDKTQIFSNTMGMRDLTEEEYEEWQQDVAEKSTSDTAVVDHGDNDATLANRTQIWSKQSGDGLDTSLNIRSRPVGGVKELSNLLGEDSADYEIIRKLAEGGMGAIYIANQRSLDRELAIKTLKPLRDSELRTFTKQGRVSQVQKQRREMFLSEALVTANLVHPHIIPIHDLCQTGDGAPFYSMKRVHGTPWNELIADMSLEDNLEVLHKVCDAIAYAHHNGVVNRDLKPENIMLGEFGEVLVLDWGLAVPATDADKKRVASPSASFGAGTPAYMSPELWAGPADAIGPCSDIYLLGAILFEAVTGKPPHQFPEPDSNAGNSGLWMIIDKVVRKNQIRQTAVGGELMDIAMKAMSTNPADRHATVLEFQEAVKNYQKHEESRRLSDRAAETLDESSNPGAQNGYQSFQTAAALFEESFATWEDNTEARDGLRATRYQYASLAHKNGDYDLGLQIAAQETGNEFDTLSDKLRRSRRLRNGLKTATLTAVAVIVVGGIFSAYQAVRIGQQNQEITQLYGTKETLEKEKGAAEQAKQLAERERLVAEKAKVDAENERQTAIAEKRAAEKQRIAAEELRTQAEMATMIANKAREQAEEQRQMAVAQQKAAEEAKAAAVAQKAAAEEQKALAQSQLKEVAVQVAGLEIQKARAGVNLHNAEIANLIRSADYAAALRGVNELIAALETDPELQKLPAVERNQRQTELQARRTQLLRRTVQTEEPINTQAISPSGTRIVWGSATGRLSLFDSEKGFTTFPAQPEASVLLDQQPAALLFAKDESLVIAAAGSVLYTWDLLSSELNRLPTTGETLTTLRIHDDLLLAADVKGNITGINLSSRQEQWKIQSATSILDIVLMPKSHMFLYAGSRGGESADILAYQLPPDEQPTARPKRLGQLRFPRDQISPPRCLAVSPSEETLVISNSRNGNLIVLGRRVDASSVKNNRFPFMQPADLQREGNGDWLVDHHGRPVNDLSFSADGTRLASASDDRTIGVWNLISNSKLELVERLEGHGARVNAAGFLDAAGNRILSASADRFCRFWNVDLYRRHRSEIENEFNLTSILTRSASRSSDSARPRRYIPAKFPNSASETSPSDSTAESSAAYRVLNADGRTQRGTMTSVAMSDDGSSVVTASTDGTAVLWNVENGEPLNEISTRSQTKSVERFEEGHDFNVSRISFLPPDGKVLLTTGFDGNLCLWDANTRHAGVGRQEIRIPGLGLVNAIAASADGTVITTSVASEEGRGGSAAVWKTDSLLAGQAEHPVAMLEGFHRSQVSAVAANHDGSLVATGGRDGRIAVWNTKLSAIVASGQLHARNTIISHIHWLSEDHILTAGFDGRIQVVTWDEKAPDSALTTALEFQHDRIPVERLTISPDASRFVSISIRTDRKSGNVSCELESWDIAFTNTAPSDHSSDRRGEARSTSRRGKLVSGWFSTRCGRRWKSAGVRNGTMASATRAGSTWSRYF